MAITVYYGTAPYDRPFRLYQLSGSYYGDTSVCIGPGQVQNGGTGQVYSWPDASGTTGYGYIQPNVLWVAQGSLNWVQFYVQASGLGGNPPNAVAVISQQNVSSSSAVFPAGSLPLCVVGTSLDGHIQQFIDKRTFSQPGNKPDWWP